MNAQEGKMTESGHCSACKDKGVIYYVKDDEIYSRDCGCIAMRRQFKRSKMLIEKSGLKETLQTKTFDTFIADDDFTAMLKDKATRYLTNHSGWFFIGGQIGCGKTHICTAMVAEFLLKQDKSVRYLQWREHAPKLKARVNELEYDDLIGDYKTADVLYIDDLFKTDSNRGAKITVGDINLAFELLNWRYQNAGITIISSEFTICELLAIDEAIGSRIYEKSKGFCTEVKTDPRKNYRLRGLV